MKKSTLKTILLQLHCQLKQQEQKQHQLLEIRYARQKLCEGLTYDGFLDAKCKIEGEKHFIEVKTNLNQKMQLSCSKENFKCIKTFDKKRR